MAKLTAEFNPFEEPTLDRKARVDAALKKEDSLERKMRDENRAAVSNADESMVIDYLKYCVNAPVANKRQKKSINIDTKD
jgi:hypothetical protein